MRAPATALLLAAALAAAAAAARAAEPPRPPSGPRPLETSCATCHAELDGGLLDPVTRAPEDIHFQKGLSCHDCHGGDPLAGADGDPEAAHNRARGWTGKPSRAAIPALCARCHSSAEFMKRYDPRARVDQMSEYLTSRHGQRHREGDTRVAICTDCHDVHGIRPVKDPRSRVYPVNVADTCARCHADASVMGRYLLPTGQGDDYRRSVHARALYDKGDLSAPTCNDCHGSHGAVPPGVQHVTNVCGTCHGREGSLFRETEAKRKLDLAACIQCLVCHGNHAVLEPTDAMLGVGPQSTCTGCHAEGEEEYAASAKMGDELARLTARLAEAEELLARAERAGVEVGPDQVALARARDQKVEARVLVHSFDLERFLAATGEGIAAADAGVEAGRRAFAELRVRRMGLGLSLIVIAAVMVALALKVRQIEGSGPR